MNTMVEQNAQNIEQRRQFEMMKKEMLAKFLTKEARERLGNVRISRPDIAEEVENMILQSAMANRLKSVIDDKKLKELLQAISQPKREQKINFNRK